MKKETTPVCVERRPVLFCFGPPLLDSVQNVQIFPMFKAVQFALLFWMVNNDICQL
jgi:hypothetical protein